MKTSELIAYLQTVLTETGDLPLIVTPREAHSHTLACPEVVDNARFYDGRELKREKAVVIR